MARALAGVLEPDDLTVIVNVGDDDEMYGLHVSPDLDTVLYTLAGIEGPLGWGVRDDTFEVMAGLSRFGVDTSFRLGDGDLALCLRRTAHLAAGGSLSEFTGDAATVLGVDVRVVPATNDRLRTRILTTEGRWLDFQDYFVIRGHRDSVREVRFEGEGSASPAPGVLDAIRDADIVVVAPSNPVLSVAPILAVGAIRDLVAKRPIVAAISPLFGGAALKGPAATVMADLGMPPGTAGVLEAYEGLISHLVINESDAADIEALAGAGVSLHTARTRIVDPEAGAQLARRLFEIVGVSPARIAAP